MGLWKSIKKAAKSVGKFVKNNWKTIVGVVAAVAIPFAAPWIATAIAGSSFIGAVAPSIAGFIGSAAGSGIIGAGLGAGAAALTGQNPLLGAALGGLGGFGGGLMGGQGMFGAASAAPSQAGLATTTGGLSGVGLGGTGLSATTATGATVSGTAALGDIAKQLALNPKNLGALASLAMTMFGKDYSELTPEEKARLEDAAQQAAVNENLFNQKVEEARKLLQRGEANPEGAYADTAGAITNQAREQTRNMPVGLQEEASRKTAIAAATGGSQAVARENERADAAKVAGLQMLPDTAPLMQSDYAVAINARRRQAEADRDEQIAKSVGGLFGNLA